MNVTELADELNRLQQIHPLSIPFVLDEAATMLRQQQAEKEALKEQLDKAIDAEKNRRFE